MIATKWRGSPKFHNGLIQPNNQERKTYVHSFFRAHTNEILPMLFTHSNTSSLLHKQLTSSTSLLWPMHNKTVCTSNIFNLRDRTEGNSARLALKNGLLSRPFQLKVRYHILDDEKWIIKLVNGITHYLHNTRHFRYKWWWMMDDEFH